VRPSPWMEECWLTKSIWRTTMWAPAPDIAAMFLPEKDDEDT